MLVFNNSRKIAAFFTCNWPLMVFSMLEILYGCMIWIVYRCCRRYMSVKWVFDIRAGVLYQRIASILNGLKNDPFYTHLVSWFAKEFSM